MTSRRLLHDGWTVQARPGQGQTPAEVDRRWVPASVPGCVHTDLMAAGLLADPLVDENEPATAWVGRTDWRYRTSVQGPERADFPSDVRHDLVFAGLDTVAEVALDGTVLGTSANMHRSYRYDVTDLLTPGPHELTVDFTSAWSYTAAAAADHGGLPSAYAGSPFNLIRKMACSFGWDWGPATVTCGIWRPVALESWSVARMDRVRPLVGVEAGRGRVTVHVDLQRAGPLDGAPLTLHARVHGHGHDSRVSVDTTGDVASVELDVPDAVLWWPHDLGEPARYDLAVCLLRDNEVLDSWSRRIGLRDVRLDTSGDGTGRAFTLVVNDQPVFARGVNWIPDDPFPHRVDRPRYELRVRRAVDAGANLVRVWGGGIYEDDDFYDVCDELGVLVWQDFLFACAAYPQEPPYDREVAAEAAENVARLMPHPSLVLWNGNNENWWGWDDWGWREQVGSRTWGRGFYLDVLPDVVARVDPTRPYWPGSPYSGSPDLRANDPDHGPLHIWDVWNDVDYLHYRSYRPRFVAEFGYQAPAAWATLAGSIHDDPLTASSTGLAAHQKALDGDAKLRRGLRTHFGVISSFDDWLYLTQVNQARALTVGVEHFRSQRPRCMGTVWWQLNDCWPAVSWSLVDSGGRPKPAWYALRRSYADRLLTVQPQDGRLGAVLVNDTRAAWSGVLRVDRLGMDGRCLASHNEPVQCPAFGAVRIELPERLTQPGDPTRELLRAVCDERTAFWWYVEDLDLALPGPRYDVEVVPREGGCDVRIRARSLLRDLCLFVDRLDPGSTVSDALLTVLPGETVTLRVETGLTLDGEALTPPVLRCTNDLATAPVS